MNRNLAYATIEPYHFFSSQNEKTKFNWFAFELACEIDRAYPRAAAWLDRRLAAGHARPDRRYVTPGHPEVDRRVVTALGPVILVG